MQQDIGKYLVHGLHQVFCEKINNSFSGAKFPFGCLRMVCWVGCRDLVQDNKSNCVLNTETESVFFNTKILHP